MRNNAIEADLLELEKQYWQAIQDRDIEAAQRLTDETCFVTGAQGVMALTQKHLADMMKRDDSYTLNKFELSDSQVRVLNADTAIVAYRVHEELTVDGKSVILDAADASTWVRREGRWVCALHTESLTGDPFGRDRNTGDINGEVNEGQRAP